MPQTKMLPCLRLFASVFSRRNLSILVLTLSSGTLSLAQTPTDVPSLNPTPILFLPRDVSPRAMMAASPWNEATSNQLVDEESRGIGETESFAGSIEQDVVAASSVPKQAPTYGDVDTSFPEAAIELPTQEVTSPCSIIITPTIFLAPGVFPEAHVQVSAPNSLPSDCEDFILGGPHEHPNDEVGAEDDMWDVPEVLPYESGVWPQGNIGFDRENSTFGEIPEPGYPDSLPLSKAKGIQGILGGVVVEGGRFINDSSETCFALSSTADGSWAMVAVPVGGKIGGKIYQIPGDDTRYTADVDMILWGNTKPAWDAIKGEWVISKDTKVIKISDRTVFRIYMREHPTEPYVFEWNNAGKYQDLTAGEMNGGQDVRVAPPK